MSNEKPVIVKSGSGGWAVAFVLAIVMIAGGLYIYNTGALDGSKDIEVKIELPKIE